MLSIYTYSIPFTRPFRTGTGDISTREGIVLVFRHDTVTAVAEASPLPGFSSESLQEVLDAISASRSQTEAFFRSGFTSGNLKQFLDDAPPLPSLQFALSHIGIDILLQKKADTLSNLFGQVPASGTAVNYTISGGDFESLNNDLQRGLREGYTTFKFKAPWPVDELIRFLNETVAHQPKIRLRLDANRSWPLQETGNILKSLSPLPIEYVEEPCDFDTHDLFLETAKQSPVPLAADESIDSLDELSYLRRSSNKIVLIIKPALAGNIFKIHETISEFGSPLNDNRVVFTTALESGIGRHMVASVTSLFGDRNRAHGLSTGRFLAVDLIGGPGIVKGFISPDFRPFSSPGFGRIDTKLLKSVE
jgi:o-succinylbenzoate synthase